MAYIYQMDGAKLMNCARGVVIVGDHTHQLWEQKDEPLCPDQTAQDLDDRFLGGGDVSSTFTVDGC